MMTMMTTRRFLPVALLAGLALAGCEKDEAAAPTDAALLARHWQLVRVEGAAVAPGPASLEFVGLGTCTVGLGPCNNFSGRFRLGSGGRLHLTAPIPTRAPCPLQALETRYLDDLARTARYETDGPELRLYDATGAAPRLVFRQGGQ